jgi:hypothetical protein
MIRCSTLAERTFKRRFVAATGMAPIAYIQRVRIEEAKRRLEETDAPVDEIGWQVGYEEPAFFRRLFKRTTGVTPGAFRRQFRVPTFIDRSALVEPGRVPDAGVVRSGSRRIGEASSRLATQAPNGAADRVRRAARRPAG